MKARFICGLLMLTLLVGSGLANSKSLLMRGAGAGTITSFDLPNATAVGEGISTVLGKFTREEQLQFTGPATFVGTIVFTAADGSQLYCDVVGGFTGAATANGTYTFTGGTGRFDGASGVANFDITLNPDGMHFTFQFTGALEL